MINMTVIANKLYKTKIDAESYNMTIDNNYIITVTLLDFNNQPIANENVTITCDKGDFYQGNYNTVYKQEYLGATIGSNFFELHFNKLIENQDINFTLIYNGNETSATLRVSSDIEDGNVHIPYSSINDNLSIKNVSLSSITRDNILYTGVNSISKTKSFTTTTKSNGTADVFYNANDWGFATISVNNNNVNTYISGWRAIELRKDIEYTINTSTFGNANPFENITIKYDNSINIMDFNIAYKSSTAYAFPKTSATIWLYFVTSDDNSNSKLLPYLINGDVQYNKAVLPSIVYYIASNPLRLNFRFVNDYSDSDTYSITANTGTVFAFQKPYNYIVS